MPVEVASVPRSRRHLRDWLDALRWPPPAREDVLLAVGEAVTNAVEHSDAAAAGSGSAAPVVEITLTIELGDRSRRVRAHVRDHGRWRAPKPDRSHFGIAFMVGLMDEASIVRSRAGTEVTLVSAWVPAR